MCQVSVISQKMIQMSKRTHCHRLEVVTPNMYHVAQLSRLNRDLDNLYELLYNQWRTVTEDDYKELGGLFSVLLDSIKCLYTSCRKAPKELRLKEETIRLGMNYSALAEINSNIVNFNIKAKQDQGLMTALSEAGALIKQMQ